MRTIREQITASTNVDRHGDSIPVEALRLLFEQSPDPWLMCSGHDPAKPPFARSYNKRFVRLENGHWAICCDVDVFDESEFAQFGGFSIAYSTKTFTVDVQRVPEIVVSVNPRVIPPDAFYQIARQSTKEVLVNVTDRIQKGLEVPAIVFVAFAAGSIATGFFRGLGADLYSLLKEKIKEWGSRVKDEHGVDLQCNMTFSFLHRGDCVEVLVSAKSADLDLLAARGLTAEAIVDHINRIAADKRLQKVVIRVVESGPPIFIEHYIDKDGLVHRLSSP